MRKEKISEKENFHGITEKMEKRPVLFSIGIMILSIIVTELPIASLLAFLENEQDAAFLQGIIEQMAVVFVIFLLLKKAGMEQEAGLCSFGKEIWLMLPAVYLIVLNLSDVLAGEMEFGMVKPGRWILFFVLHLSTGFFEEILCRGLMLPLFLKKWGNTKNGAYLALVISALLFGMAHFTGFLMGRQSLLAAVAQVIYATFFGVFAGACVVRMKSIYPMILLHTLINISGELGTLVNDCSLNESYYEIPLEGAVFLVILALPLLLYGLFLVRKEFKNGYQM
ncbi:CPBP family intramembrane metalloprotease [Roseburia hominis]|uniref:type II CAAX endopeptidase family protein n=1 Tax=Roseburia hominis TaxID=301301 RepID=UPI001F35B83E|nr:CPBP family intramembrane metalloprotease [Roseburia hominis]